MKSDQIQSALADITAETDPTLKHRKLASLVSTIFRERGIELVVVGGSAIEFYTDGAYVSGDLDLCVASSTQPLTILLRQELMGALQAKGGRAVGRSAAFTSMCSAHSRIWRARRFAASPRPLARFAFLPSRS